MTRRAVLLLFAAIVFLAPFGEGGRAPWALFVLHALILVSVLLAAAVPAPPGRAAGLRPGAPLGLLAAGAAGLALALASALGASYPLAAGLGLCDLLFPAALFAAAARLSSVDEDRDHVLRLLVVASAVLQAILALARYPSGGPEAAGAVFLNRNHLAAFLNVGVFLALPVLASARARLARLAWGGAVALLVVTLFLLESRGAFVAFFTALVVFGALRLGGLGPGVRRLAAAFMIVCVVGAAVVLGERFARAPDPYRYARAAIWKASAAMIAERPLLGFGPGMFPHVSARFNFPVDSGPVRYGRVFRGAHSAWLTLAAETGLPAAALILGALCGAAVLFLRARPDEEMMLGAGLALLALLTHGLFEDLAERPALTFVAALVAGPACAALLRRARAHDPAAQVAAQPRPPGFIPPGPARLAGATLAIYVFLVAVFLPYRADREASAAWRLGKSGLARMERAATLNQLHPEYRNGLAMAILNSGPLDPEGYARVSTLLIEARRLKPIDYRFPLHLARLEARFAPRLFDDAGAMERAAALYREAVRLAPLDPRPRLELAGHLVELGRKEEALATLNQALLLEPNFLRARVLQASILLDSGRREEARTSLGMADGTIALLAGYEPDSGYARDITMDARLERERLAAVLGRHDPKTKSS